MGHHSEAFIGIDTSKSGNAVAIAEGVRGGEVRFLGEFPATEAAMRKLVAKLAAKYSRLTFCYEAGPTGYGLYRLIKTLVHECIVVAPSLIPKMQSLIKRQFTLPMCSPRPKQCDRAASWLPHHVGCPPCWRWRGSWGNYPASL